jgi:hypothetical protein
MEWGNVWQYLDGPFACQSGLAKRAIKTVNKYDEFPASDMEGETRFV